MTHTRPANVAHAVTATTPLLARVATQTGTTVATYLRSHGVHATWIAHWGSAFGRKAATLFRKANDGADPRKRFEAGRDVYAYDTVTELGAALDHYRAHPKAGPALVAGYDRARAAAKAPRDARGRFVRILVIVWTTPAGRQRRTVPAATATALVRALTRHHRVTDLTVRDARGRTAYALAA